MASGPSLLCVTRDDRLGPCVLGMPHLTPCFSHTLLVQRPGFLTNTHKQTVNICGNCICSPASGFFLLPRHPTDNSQPLPSSAGKSLYRGLLPPCLLSHEPALCYFLLPVPSQGLGEDRLTEQSSTERTPTVSTLQPQSSLLGFQERTRRP